MDREEGTNWSTPFVWENERRTEIVTAGTDHVRSYDLDGKLLWELSGMSTISIPTPFARARAALHQLGLHRRPDAAGVRDSSGRIW